jgi:hypothetical protein
VRQYSVDHQNYHIFKTETGEKNQYVHFQWGKFDFRMTFNTGSKDALLENPKKAFASENGKQYLAGLFEVLYQSEWFEFIKPTAHGMQLEETLWSRNGQDYYVEFPKDIRSVAQVICAEELGMSPLAAVSA